MGWWRRIQGLGGKNERMMGGESARVKSPGMILLQAAHRMGNEGGTGGFRGKSGAEQGQR